MQKFGHSRPAAIDAGIRFPELIFILNFNVTVMVDKNPSFPIMDEYFVRFVSLRLRMAANCLRNSGLAFASGPLSGGLALPGFLSLV